MSELACRFPEAALLAVPAALIWWCLLRRGSGSALRAVVLVLLVLAAMDPELAWGRGGSDVVVVFDRSDSLLPPPTAAEDREEEQRRARLARDRHQAEMLRLIGEQRDVGDRLAAVLVGRTARTAQPPRRRGLDRLADTSVAGDGSDLHAGLELAAGLIPADRAGRVVLMSDGEATGRNPRAAAASLALAGIPVDVVPADPPSGGDAAVLEVEVPNGLRLGESFIGSLRFVGRRAEDRAWEVHRDGERIAAGTVSLRPDRPTAASFVDRPVRPGITRYRVSLDATNDRLPLNNTAHAALRVRGGQRILVVGGDGRPGNIARALGAGGLTVDCRPEGPVGFDELFACRAVVLEQVPADRLGGRAIRNLARWVEHLGGGLVMCGGRRSFGAGGYHRSELEEVLPVTMEIRDEHRKLSVAMAVCLDRSGSMGMTVAGGLQKMDLANRGTAAVVELLSPLDQIAVFAVDSAPHTVLPLTGVSDAPDLVERILAIEAGGGGIYVHAALVAGGRALLDSDRGVRHLVLFADAADAEMPGAYQKLLADYRRAGITVSVIGLGGPGDPDADLLRDVAKRGGGRIAFAKRAVELPRLFAHETVLISRSSWIDEPVRLVRRPELSALLGTGALAEGWPQVAGYNLCYPRERASVAAWAPGDPGAPAVSTWHIGTGRSVAICVDCDGPDSAELTAWSGYGPLLGGLARWAAGAGTTGIGALHTERAGHTVTARLELDPARRERWPERPPTLLLMRDGDDTPPPRLALAPVDDGVYEAVFALDDEAVTVPVARLHSDGRAVALAGPALRLPYSPEAAPRLDRAPGSEVLADIAAVTRGTVRRDLLDCYANPASPGTAAGLAPLLLAAAILLVVAEILVRRLELSWRPRRRAPVAAGRPTSAAPAVPPAPAEPPASGSAEPQAHGVQQDRGLHEALRQLRRR